MQIKQFEGTSMEEILARVKKTLGDDAVILSTRKQAKKKMGAFTAAVYEVSAAVDPPAGPRAGIRTRGRVLDTVVAVGNAPAAGYARYAPAPQSPAPKAPRAVVSDEPPAHAAAHASFAVPAPFAAPVAAPVAASVPAPAPGPAASKPAPFEAFLSFEKELAPLKDEIASLKGFLELVLKERAASPDPADARLDRLADEIRALKRELVRSAAEGTNAAAPAPAPAPEADSGAECGPDPDWLVRRLLEQGMSPAASRRIGKAARARCASPAAATDAELRRAAGEYLSSMIRVAELPPAKEGAPRILAFVGPAGAGKTATVARVGRMLAKRGFRCAAVSVGEPGDGNGFLLRELQLPHGIPVLCARDASELSRAIAVCYGAQYLLVDVEGDACGREAAARMTSLFAGHADIDFCLTLPAGWDRTPADRVVSDLSPLPVNYLAFTKIDGAGRHGNLFKAAAVSGRPVLFLSGGDGSGGTVFPARPHMFSRLLLDKPAPEARMSR